MTPKKLGVPTAALLGLALVGAACGSGDGRANGTADGTADSNAVEQVVAGTETGAADGSDDDTPGSLAAVDESEQEPGDGDQAPPVIGGGLPALDEIESLLDQFTVCLNEEGADVSVLTIRDMTARLPTLPADAGEAELFAHFYDRDISDPVVAAAMETCEPILDDPAIAMFLPTE